DVIELAERARAHLVDLNNQSSYRQKDGTTRKPSPPTTGISTRTSGEQLSRPFPPRLKLFPLFLVLLLLALTQIVPSTSNHALPNTVKFNPHTWLSANQSPGSPITSHLPSRALVHDSAGAPIPSRHHQSGNL
ncbi:hypothetical protein BGX38DRAFT_1334902, partial [Terfezia claveryi]